MADQDSTDRPYQAGDDLDLDKIVHNAVASVGASQPHSDLTVRARLALLLAALIVIANSVIGIYNSLALRQEVQCDHKLNSAIQVVGDQNRNITKQVIDTVLSGKAITRKEIVGVKKRYDHEFAVNTRKRQALLQTTCNDGTATTSPSGG